MYICGGRPTEVVEGVKPPVTQGWVTGGAGVTGVGPNVDSGLQTQGEGSTHQEHHDGMGPIASRWVLDPLWPPTNASHGSLGGLHDRWTLNSAVRRQIDTYEVSKS